MKYTNLFAWILGLFYIVSSIGKGFDYTSFAHILSQYNIPHFSGYILIVIEMVVGLLLISTTKRRIPSLMSMTILVLFSLVYTYGYYVLGVRDCGCFGKFDFLNSSSIAGLLVRNSMLFVVSFLIFKDSNLTIDYPFKQVYTSYFSAALIVSAIVFTPSGEQDLIGKSPKLIGVSPDSLQKEHIIFLFMPSCSHCRTNAITVSKEYDKTKSITGLTFTGHDDEIQSFKDSLNISFPIMVVEKPRLRKYFKSVPRFIYVHEGVINTISDSLMIK